MNNCRNRSKLYNARFKTKELRSIGKGRQGIVFVVSRYSNGSQPFAMKITPYDLASSKRSESQPAEFEFKNQKCAQSAAPNGVVRVFKLKKCDNFISPSVINMPNVQNTLKYNKSRQYVMYMEYCAGGSLKNWLAKQKNITDNTLLKIMKSVTGTLYKIQKKYPYFRHNDLHMDNVFVSKRGFLIGDFGWSRVLRMGTNPAVNTANGTSTASYWGVGPRTDARYDHHMFLNEMLYWVKTHRPSRFPKSYAFLNTVIPDGYRGESDTHVLQWRLKYGDPCPGLPTLRQVILNFRSKLKTVTTTTRRVSSRRPRIKGPSGRMVYADGSSITLKYLKNIARKRRVSVTGLTKRQIVSKIFRV